MQRLASILLSSLILLSSSGLAYVKHYCGDVEIISKVSLGTVNLNCGMVKDTSPCGEGRQQEGHFCCSNKYLKVYIDDQYAKVSFDLDLIIVGVIPIFEVFVPGRLEVPTKFKDSYGHYRPPPLAKNYQTLFETFLI